MLKLKRGKIILSKVCFPWDEQTDDLARPLGGFSMPLPLAPCLEQLSQRDRKAASSGAGTRQHRLTSAKLARKSRAPQEPPPWVSDPGTQHPPAQRQLM